MRTNPVIQAFFKDLDSGVIGEPQQVVADFAFYKPSLPTRLLDPALGGGSLMDGGIYPMTFAYMALGRPAELKAVGSLNDDGIDLNVAMAWRYDSGAVAALTCGLRSQNPWVASVSGPEGSLQLPHRFHHPEYYVRSTAAGAERIDVPVHGLGYHYEASRSDAGAARRTDRGAVAAACRDARDPRTARRDPEPDRGPLPR